MEKKDDIIDELILMFNKRLDLDLEKKNCCITIAPEIELFYILETCNDIAIFIVQKKESLSFSILNEMREKVLSYEIFKDKKPFFYIVSLNVADVNLKKELNDNGFLTVFDNVPIRLITMLVDYYILYQGKDMPRYDEIIRRYDKQMLEYEDHIENKGYSILFSYHWVNEIYPFLDMEKSKQLYYEKNVILSKLSPEKGKYDKSEYKGMTFKPISSYINEKGEKKSSPNIYDIKEDRALEGYFYKRYNETVSLLLKYRYYELLLFINSKLINKPLCFQEIISLLKLNISHYRDEKIKVEHLGLVLIPYYQRIIEIMMKYINKSSLDEINQIVEYHISAIQQLEADNDYRWILDMIEIITIYKGAASYFINYKNYLYDLLLAGIEHYKIEENSNLEIAFIDCYKKARSEFDENNDHSIYIELKAKSYENEAFRKEKENNYLAAIHFIKIARDQYLSDKSLYKEKIREINILSKKWHKESLKEMKMITPKIDTSQIKQQHDKYIEELSVKEINEIVECFFTDYKLLMSEENFINAIENTDNSIASLITSTSFLDEERTIFSPQNPDENKELDKWLWYGKLIQIYLPWINYIFNNLLNRDILTVNNIIDYIAQNERINEDDQKFLIDGFKLYSDGYFSSSISLTLPLVERFFRNFKSEIGDDIQYTKNKSYHNIQLDKLIQDSEEYGVPRNIILFGRYFFSQERGGFNLRNRLSHGLMSYESLNDKGLNEIVLWFLSFCFFSNLSS